MAADRGSSGSSFLAVGSSLRIRRRSSSTVSKRRLSRRRVPIKRSSRLRIERRVRTLERLIPSSSRSTGLEGLFQDTADYILSLQTRVRVMQMMVDILAGSEQ